MDPELKEEITYQEHFDQEFSTHIATITRLQEENTRLRTELEEERRVSDILRDQRNHAESQLYRTFSPRA